MTIQELRTELTEAGFTIPFFAVNTWPRRTREDVKRWLVYRERKAKDAIRSGRPVLKPAILERYVWEPQRPK